MIPLILGAAALATGAVGVTKGADLASGNNEQLALALNSITEIAKSSPFKELASLSSVRTALNDPNHEWTF